ncbi:hypothetical protein ASD15_21010 [Massilia sp. Root351]|nr:hypothetical protein ASD15_21010 [Massilia sp. Root351]
MPLAPAADAFVIASVAVLSAAVFQAYWLLEDVLRWYPSTTLPALIAVAAACLAASGVSYASVPRPLATLMRGVGMACGVYSLLLYPSLPAVAHDFKGWSQSILNLAWLMAAMAALLSMRRPAWLLYCGFYIYWIKHAAGYITGFSFHTLLDVNPMIQLPVYLSLSVLTLELAKRRWPATWPRIGGSAPYWTILFIAIAMQAANYFHSSLAKGGLDGGVLDWALNNENRNIYHVALHNKQLLWGDWSALTGAVSALLQVAGRPFAIGVFLIQLAAILVFANRRLLLVLFALFDLMHIGIFVLVGANFWTWFMVNLSIIAAVSQLPRDAFNWRTGAAGALAILLSPLFANVAKLGWYDSLAVNTVHFDVELADGKTERMPSTAFGFYSYPISHMSFGLPPGKYLPTATNGGTFSSAIRRQSYRCAFASAAPATGVVWDGASVSAFIRAYHRQVLNKAGAGGRWSNTAYPHHFWSAPSVEKAFAGVDMRRVRAYRMVIDSVCLDPDTGAVKRKVYRNEYRIDLAG